MYDCVDRYLTFFKYFETIIYRTRGEQIDTMDKGDLKHGFVQHGQLACRALLEAFRDVPTKGGPLAAPLCIYFTNAAHNALHAADQAAGHAAGHAVQSHVLKILYLDLGMPKPYIKRN